MQFLNVMWMLSPESSQNWIKFQRSHELLKTRKWKLFPLQAQAPLREASAPFPSWEVFSEHDFHVR